MNLRYGPATSLQQFGDLDGVAFDMGPGSRRVRALGHRASVRLPRLEFEVDHSKAEQLEEVGLGIGLFVPLSFILGGIGDGSYCCHRHSQ